MCPAYSFVFMNTESAQVRIYSKCASPTSRILSGNETTHGHALQDTSPCPDYVLSYTLVVEDSEGNRTVLTVQATGGVVDIVVDNLVEDTRYWYHVIATNQFGSKQSFPVEICKCIRLFTVSRQDFTFNHNYYSNNCRSECFNLSCECCYQQLLHPVWLSTGQQCQGVWLCPTEWAGRGKECYWHHWERVFSWSYTTTPWYQCLWWSPGIWLGARWYTRRIGHRRVSSRHWRMSILRYQILNDCRALYFNSVPGVAPLSVGAIVGIILVCAIIPAITVLTLALMVSKRGRSVHGKLITSMTWIIIFALSFGYNPCTEIGCIPHNYNVLYPRLRSGWWLFLVIVHVC